MKLHRAAMYTLCLVGLLVACDDDDDLVILPLPDGDYSVDAVVDQTPDASPAIDAGRDPAAEIAALVASVDLTRFSADLEFIARGSRHSPGGENWQATQGLCADTMLQAGLEVVRQPIVDGGVNVIGVLPGVTRPEEHVLIGAHYDSEFDCVGADDNASGVAAVLEAARVLGTRRFERSLVFACFDAEEHGLVGAADYTARARQAEVDFEGVLVLEMIGYTDDRPGRQLVPAGLDLAFPDLGTFLAERSYRGDFLLYAADDDPEMIGHLRAAAEAVGLPIGGVQLDRALRESPLTAPFKRSDHASFWAEGYPGIVLTDTANYRNPTYHCLLGEDDIDTIDFDFALLATQASVGAMAAAAVPADGMPAEGRQIEPEPTPGPGQPACGIDGSGCDEGQRCALAFSGERRLTCTDPPADPLPLDAPCERAVDGTDDCAPGLFCTLTGRALGDPRRCRPLCRSTVDCAEGQACPDIGGEASNCIEGCDPFGDDCPAGTFCGLAEGHDGEGYGVYCRQAGTAGEGEDCGRDECVPGLICSSDYSIAFGLGCLAWCRPSAPDCNPGRVCLTVGLREVPDDLGLCVPEGAIVE